MPPEAAVIKPVYDENGVTLYHSHSLFVMMSMPDNSVDSIVTDPPYGLSFMGKKWDYDVPSVQLWAEALRVLKPGGHLLAFAGSRTYHRMAINIEDAGFTIRDQIMWIYGSGFPKSMDISKAIDNRGDSQIGWFGPWLRQWRKENNVTQKEIARLFPSNTGGLTGCVANWELGLNMPTPDQFNRICQEFELPFNSLEEAEREVIGQHEGDMGGLGGTRLGDGGGDITKSATPEAKQWEGWGTALKSAHEPIVVARKPVEGTVAENVLKYGTGGINIDRGRIEGPPWKWGTQTDLKGGGFGSKRPSEGDVLAEDVESNPKGRWPSNIMFDPEAAAMLDAQSGESVSKDGGVAGWQKDGYVGGKYVPIDRTGHDDSGGASRFFYVAKASKADRDEGLEGFEMKKGGIKNEAGRGFSETDPYAEIMRRNNHPTVKPTELMQYLVRLVTPKGGVTFDPFMGSGSTGKGAVREGMKFIGAERDGEYVPISIARIKAPAQVT